MAAPVIAILSQADLAAWREWAVREQAINAVEGTGYSREEIESHYRRWQVLMAEFVSRYDLPDDDVHVSEITGRITLHGND